MVIFDLKGSEVTMDARRITKSERMRRVLKKRWQDPKERERFIAGAKSQWTKEKKADRTKELKKLWSKGVFRNHGDKIRAKWADPEYRKRLSEAHKKHWKDPKYRSHISKKRREMARNPEYIEKQKASNRANWSSQEFVKSQGLPSFLEMKKRIEKVSPDFGVAKTNKPTQLILTCPKCETQWKEHWCYVKKHIGRCPQCEPHFFKGIEESRVRKLFEKVTGWKFKKVRPSWLKGRGKAPLELDGYNEKHEVAFEYQGFQHYEPIWGEDKLKKRKLDDDRKRKLCEYHGITLIRVPYFKKDLEGFIKKKLAEAGVIN